MAKPLASCSQMWSCHPFHAFVGIWCTREPQTVRRGSALPQSCTWACSQQRLPDKFLGLPCTRRVSSTRSWHPLIALARGRLVAPGGTTLLVVVLSVHSWPCPPRSCSRHSNVIVPRKVRVSLSQTVDRCTALTPLHSCTVASFSQPCHAHLTTFPTHSRWLKRAIKQTCI